MPNQEKNIFSRIREKIDQSEAVSSFLEAFPLIQALLGARNTSPNVRFLETIAVRDKTGRFNPD